MSHTAPSRTSSKRTSASVLTRRHLEIELRTAKEIKQLEEKEAQRRLKRKTKLLQLQARMEIAELEEDVSQYTETVPSEESEKDDADRVTIEKTESLAHLTEQLANAKVRS